jgi:hypothetical protein
MDYYAPARVSMPAPDWQPGNWWDPDEQEQEGLDADDVASLQWWEARARQAVCSVAQQLSSADLVPPNPLQLGNQLPGSDMCMPLVICNRARCR